MIEQQQQISATRTEENRQISAADPTETDQDGNNTALWFVFFGVGVGGGGAVLSAAALSPSSMLKQEKDFCLQTGKRMNNVINLSTWRNNSRANEIKVFLSKKEKKKSGHYIYGGGLSILFHNAALLAPARNHITL